MRVAATLGGLGRLVCALGVAALLAAPAARAAGCDLGLVVGYTLAQEKTIEGYIDKGARTRGYVGCQPGRVLVFTDNTGVACKGVSIQKAAVPKAYLFAKS